MSLDSIPSAVVSLTPLRAEVDLSALRYNVEVLKKLAGEAELIGVVKANAYGHGGVEIARELVVAGVVRLAVANLLEGVELREAGIEEPILVLAAPLQHMLPTYTRYRLGVTVSSTEVAKAVVGYAAQSGPLIVHVKVDTGMTRLGLAPSEVSDTVAMLKGEAGVTVEGLLTHYATVDHVFTVEQSTLFDTLVSELDDQSLQTHGANSGTLLFTPETVRGKSLVRVGGALFGLMPPDQEAAADVHLKPVMRLVSRVVHLREIPTGTTVSYGRTWTAAKATQVATVAVGYGDGLPRSLSNRGQVGINGSQYPIVGRVCMDMLMVDVGLGADVQLGDEVVLFGPGGPSAVEAATAAGTIAYDLTSGLTPRVPRVYVS